jgi:hypothetical protein
MPREIEQEFDEIINRVGLQEACHLMMVYCSEQAQSEEDEDKADFWEEMADGFSELERQAEYL